MAIPPLGFGIRINKKPPNIVFKKKDKGGIAITATQPLTQWLSGCDGDTTLVLLLEHNVGRLLIDANAKALQGKGRGRQVIAVAKTCNLIFIVLDVNKPLVDKRVIDMSQWLSGCDGDTTLVLLLEHNVGRLLIDANAKANKKPPNIVFKKKDKGGIAITATQPLTHIDHDVRSHQTLCEKPILRRGRYESMAEWL
jgi:ribosome-interacting GTPase 1